MNANTFSLARGFTRGRCFFPIRRVGDFSTLHYGKALQEAQRRSGPIPVYGTNGVTGSHDTPLTPGPGVVIGRKGMGNLGVKWSNNDFWVIDTAYFLKVDPDIADLQAMYYLFNYVGLNHLKDGTSNPSLQREVFYAQQVPVPPISEQIKIASFLRSLDDKIDLNRRTNQTLEAIAGAIFKSWFVDFDPVRAKMDGSQPYGMDADTAGQFPSMFQASPIGTVPDGWTVTTLGELATSTRGVSYRSAELTDSDTALVTLKSIVRGGGYSPRGLKAFRGAYKQAQVVSPGEIVVAHTDLTQAAEVVGRPAIVEPSSAYSTLVASLDLAIVRPRGEDVSQEFVLGVMSQPAFTDHVLRYTNGTTVIHLSNQAIPAYRLACPPAAIIRKFTGITEPLRAQILVNQRQTETLTHLRDSLLPKLFSGELRVKDAANLAGEVV